MSAALLGAQTGADASGSAMGFSSDPPPGYEGRNWFEQTIDSGLDFVEGDVYDYLEMGAGVAVPTGMAMYGAASGGALAAGSAAFWPAAAIVGAGWAGGKLGSIAGDWLGHQFMQSAFMQNLGYGKMVDAEYPAVIGDPIAHVSKWATLGAMVLGAVAAVAVAAIIIGTAGTATPFLVVAASVAFGSGGMLALGAAFASAAGQYGKNKGKIATGSPDVFFEGKNVARFDDIVECEEHGPVHVLAEGSKTVFANGRPIVRVGHQSTCAGKVNDGRQSLGIDLTTHATKRDIDGGWLERATRIGVFLTDIFMPGPSPTPNSPTPSPSPEGDGPTPDADAPTPDADTPTPDADAATPDAPTPDAPTPESDGPTPQSTTPATTPSQTPSTPNNKPEDHSSGTQNKPDDTAETCADPVDVATGQIVETRTDISIPGTIPLVLNRSYRAGCEGIQGRNWSGTWSQHLRLKGEEIVYQDPQGVLITFHTPEENVRSRNICFPHLTLVGKRSGRLYIFDRHEQQFYIFSKRVKNRALLSRIEDRNRNRIDFIYGEEGLRKVSHSDGFSLTVESRDMLIRRAVLEAPGSKDCGFVWNYTGSSLLSEVISSQTGTLRYSYDEEGRITSWADTKLSKSHYEYGPDGRVARNWLDSGHMGARFDYDLARNRTVVTNVAGDSTIYDWDKRGLVWRKIDAQGGEWLTEWGRAYNVLSRTDPLGHTVNIKYDREGNVISVTDAEGHSESWTYHLSGRIQSYTDQMGLTHRFHYDQNANLMTVEAPNGTAVRYRRAANGQILRTEYPGNRQERYYYDMLNRPSKVMTVGGFDQHMRFDAEGRLQHYSDEIGAVTEWDYTRSPDNPRGDMVSVTLPDGSVTTAAYDSEGMMSRTTDGEGATQHLHFGALDLFEGYTDAKGHRLTLEYDPECRLSAVVNQLGQRYELERDSLGRVTAERDYSGLVTRYDYDAAGRVTQRTSPDGTIARFTRNARGHATRVEHQRGTEVSKTDYEFDAAGRLVKLQDAESLIEYVYDNMGRITEERLNGRTIRSHFDENGIGRVARDGDVLPLHAEYSHAGQLAQLKIGDQQPLSFAYDPRGFEIMRGSDAGFTLRQGHNIMGQLAEQIAGPLAAFPAELRYAALGDNGSNEHMIRAGALAHRSYLWDRAQRAISVNDRITGESRYSYDPRGQVVGAQKTQRGADPILRQFGYAPDMNLTEIATGAQSEKVDQQAGRVKRRGNVHYTHDDAGRVIEKRVEENGFRARIWRMEWDARSRLVRLQTPEGDVWRYVYDALGRRIQRLRLVPGGKEGDPQGGGSAYQWEGSRIVAEAPIGPDGHADWQAAAHWIYEPGTFRPVARAVGSDIHYVVTDHIGTPRELFTEDGTAVAWRQDLSLWGEPEATPARRAANDDTAPVDCPIRFQGQWFDEESGLHYNNYRYYDPEATQYLSPDPIGLAGGVRPQGYVADPNGWVDPLGLAACDRFGNIDPQNAQEAQFLANAETTFRNSSTWTSATRHRGEIVIQRSDIALTPQNIIRMRNGNAPFVRNAAGKYETVVLHHVGRTTGQVIEVTKSQNTYNHTTGGPLHIPGSGGPVRQNNFSQTYWKQRYQDYVDAGLI